MNRQLAKSYNVHKRKTIERITKGNTKKLYLLISNYAEENAKSILEDLEAGRSVKIDQNKIISKVSKVLESHIDNTIDIGIADGMQEISKDHKLNNFLNFPLYFPVEQTLTLAQKKDKDKIFKKVFKKFAKEKGSVIKELALGFTKMQLKTFASVFESLAKDWVAGNSTIKDVKQAIQKEFLKTYSQAERIFRTETTRWFNKSRAEYFSSETMVDYYQIFAITDGRVSKICESRHGFVFKNNTSNLQRFTPPFHPNCRTVLKPLISKLKGDAKIIEIGLRIKPSGFYPLPKNWSNAA